MIRSDLLAISDSRWKSSIRQFRITLNCGLPVTLVTDFGIELATEAALVFTRATLPASGDVYYATNFLHWCQPAFQAGQ